jgi:geranylgeranyl diphosphate synthase type II
MIKALESCTPTQVKELKRLMQENPADKVERVLTIFKEGGVDKWAVDLKEKYINSAFQHLENIAVVSGRKGALTDLAHFLVQREY